MRRLVSISLLVTVVLSFQSGPAGAATFCDPNLASSVESPLRYQEREGRCEGIYAQQVGAVTLDVRSFVQSFGPFDPQKDTELELRWASPPGAKKDVRLRSFSFRSYYRMDTAVPAAQGVFRWPTDLLAREKLGREELGVIAWTELPGPAGASRKVYLPLQIKARTAASLNEYKVSVVPSERLKEVRISVSRLDSRGNVVATLRRGEDLGYGTYPSNKPTEFSIGSLGEAGFYRLDISAKGVSGHLVQQDLEFYHSGK